MPLILAIEPDRRQAAQLKSIAHDRLGAELVLAETADAALEALGDRVPDLILTPALLSGRDEAALNDRLRALEREAQYVQTLTIPLLAAPPARKRARGMLAALRREKPKAATVDGCDPAVFAEQCLAYLERATVERETHAAAIAEAIDLATPEPSPTSAGPETTFGLRDFYVGSSDAVPLATVEPSSRPVFTLPEAPVHTELSAERAATARVELDAFQAPVAQVDLDADETTAHVTPAQDAQPEDPPAAVAIRTAQAIPECLGVRQLWPTIEGLQTDHFLAEEPSSMNGDAVYDVALHLEVLAPERKADSDRASRAPMSTKASRVPSAVEAPEIAETQSSRDDDLQIFDLDLLADRFEEKPASIDTKPSWQETADSETSPASETSGVDASDEADLQVYDLDLSTLLGEPEEASGGVAAQPQDATSGGARREAHTLVQTVDAPAPVMASASDDEEVEVEVYDLDLDLIEDSFDDQPAAVVAESSTRAQSEAKPSPSVPGVPGSSGSKDAASAPRRPTAQPIAQSDAAPAPGNNVNAPKLNARSEERKRTVDANFGAASEVAQIAEAEPTRREIEEDERGVIRSGIWAPLRLGVHQLWPRLDSGVSPPPRLAVVGPADAPVVTILPTSSNESKRPEWLKAIKSLGRDNTRSQAAIPVQQPVEIPSESTTAALRPPAGQAPQQEQAPTAPAPTKVQTAPEDGTLSKSKKRRMARKAKKKNAVRSDWGFFEPDEAGFASLVNKLDEITDKRDDGFPSDS